MFELTCTCTFTNTNCPFQAVGSPSAPAGGLTSNVWVVDSTPPALRLVEVFAISQSSLQIRLQLDEPGTVWHGTQWCLCLTHSSGGQGWCNILAKVELVKSLVPVVTAGVLHWRLTTPLSAQLVTCQPATLPWAATMRLLSKASRPCRQPA